MKVGAPKQWAAGLPGVAYALNYARQQMGAARSAATLTRVNQHEGFDCPGCAWPEPQKRAHAEFCENGAKAVADEATRKRADAAFFAKHPVSELRTWSGHQLNQQGRIIEPMVRRADGTHYRPIAWDDAFALIAQELKQLASPDEAIFYTSGRTSNEAAFVYQLFVRAFGTNNLPDCSNLCHESSGSALGESIGIGKGSVTLEDIHQSDLIFVVGQNPGTNHPRMLTALERAKRNGAKIIAVNPLPEAGLLRFRNPQRPSGIVGKGTQLADVFLQIRLGGDLALFKALSRLLLDAERERPGTVLDTQFLAERCEGFDTLKDDLQALDWDAVLAATGLKRIEIEHAAKLAASADSTIVCWAMGLTQHPHSVATIREIANFLLLRGNIGRPGAGLCPVRGHSNVQGDRTMGIWEKPTQAFLDRLAAAAQFEPPREPGHDVVEAIRALRDGTAHVFMAMGGNFAEASPDTALTQQALAGTRLNVQVSTKLNRSHTVTGARALILPVIGRTEIERQDGVAQVVSVEDSMCMVHGSRGNLEPASEHLLSEVSVVCRLAAATLGPHTPVDWRALERDYAQIRALIEQVVPGFENFEARLKEDGGFALPHRPRDERRFDTPSGKAVLTVNPIEYPEIPAGRLLLQSIRSHDQYNTTIYALNDRYRGIKGGRRVVLVNPDDLTELGHADGDVVDLISEWRDGSERRAERFRVTAYPTARGCAAAYFPEANALVALDHTAVGSNTPASKSVVVRLEPRAA